MRTLAIAAGLAALVVATPALANGGGGSSGNSGFSHTAGSLNRVFWSFWGRDFGSPPGRHFGWFHGKHWGWFKPHHPHFPHEPPASP